MEPTHRSTRADQRRRTKWALVASACLAASLAWAGAAGGQVATRSAAISPNSELTVQVVTVSWAGFPKSKLTGTHRVAILQCTSPADSFDDCYLQSRGFGSPPGNEVGLVTPTPVYGRTAIDGTGSTLFEVRPARYLPELGCGEENDCELVVLDRDEVPTGTYDAAPLPAARAVVPLDFATEPATCGTGTPDLRIIGEESARHALYDWAIDTCLGEDELIVDYTQTSGPRGRESFKTGDAEVGVTSRPVPTAEIAGSRTFAYAPLAATSTVVVFRAFDKTAGRPIENIKLSPRLMARIMSSSANYNSVSPGGPGVYGGLENIFDDPEFRALNPGAIDWPDFGVFTPFVRAEEHDDAYLLTSWLANDTDARAFLSGADRCGRPMNSFWAANTGLGVPAAIDTYPIDAYENRSANSSGLGFRPVQGTESSVRRFFNGIINGAGPIDFGTGIYSDAVEGWEVGSRGFVGVTDLGTALAFQLPIADLVPARTGTEPTITSCGPVGAPDVSQTAVRATDALASPVALTDESLAEAYDVLLPDPGKGPQAAFAASTFVAGAFPLARVDYGLVPTSGLTAVQVSDVVRFLDYAGGDGQDNLPFGLPELPSDFVVQTAAAAAAVRAQDGSTPNPPPEPPPVTPPITFPSGTGGFSDAGGFASPSASGAPAAAAPTVEEPAEEAVAGLLPVIFASVTPEGGPAVMVLPVVLALGLVAALSGILLVGAPKRRPKQPDAVGPDAGAGTP